MNHKILSVMSEHFTSLVLASSGITLLLCYSHFAFGFDSDFLMLKTYLLLLFILGVIFTIQKVKGKPTNMLIISLVLGFSILNGLLLHHTNPAYRDAGGYTSQALLLSKTHTLTYELNYNLPAFTNNNNVLSPGFLPGYSTVLAASISIFGSNYGIEIAQICIMILALFAIYLTVKELTPNTYAPLLTVIFFITSFTTIWFSRRTLSENLVLLLFWSSSYLILKGYRKSSSSLLLASLIPTSALLLVRVEGIGLLLVNVFVITAIMIKHKLTYSKFNLFILLVVAANILVSYYNFRTISFDYISQQFTIFSASHAAPDANQAIQVHEDSGLFLNLSTFEFVINLFNSYLISPFILLILGGFFRKMLNKKLCILILLASPVFVYLIDPKITQDQPWAMRRYWPIIIPLIYSIASLVITKLSKKHLLASIIITISLLLMNLYNTLPFATYTQQQTFELSSNMVHLLSDENVIVLTPNNYYNPIGRWTTYLYATYNLPIIWTPFISDAALTERVDSAHKIYLLSDNSDIQMDTLDLPNIIRERLTSTPEIIDTTEITEDIEERSGIQFPRLNTVSTRNIKVYLYQIHI